MSEWCRHYNGIGVSPYICDVGVRYADVKVEADSMYDRFPCFEGSTANTCERRDFLTAEEKEERDRKSHESIAKFFADIEAGTCPHCGKAMKKRQIGPCVYAEPCGHRLYQGRV